MSNEAVWPLGRRARRAAWLARVRAAKALLVCLAVIGLGACAGVPSNQQPDQSPAAQPSDGPAAQPSDGAGRLTFMRKDPDGHWQVWVSNTDLGEATQLTYENANSGWPVWSPNGQKIAFESDRTDPNTNDDPEINDVFTMNADGSSVTQLTDSRVGPSGDPGWSPDGSLIAFESDAGNYPQNQGVYVMRADGSHVRRLTTLPAPASPDGPVGSFDVDSSARFSPDGRRLVFTRLKRGQGGALFTTDLKGHINQITSYAIGAGDAVWSPHGNKIVFEAKDGDVHVVNSTGKHLRNLTHYAPEDQGGGLDPVWSPDQREILFGQGLIQQQGSSPALGLAIMKSDGSDRHFIEDPPIESHQPDWVRP